MTVRPASASISGRIASCGWTACGAPGPCLSLCKTTEWDTAVSRLAMEMSTSWNSHAPSSSFILTTSYSKSMWCHWASSTPIKTSNLIHCSYKGHLLIMNQMLAFGYGRNSWRHTPVITLWARILISFWMGREIFWNNQRTRGCSLYEIKRTENIKFISLYWVIS